MWEELFRKGVESGGIAGDVAAPTRVLDGGVATSRDPDYWFDDGNIILVSQGVAFRVYKGLLAEHSMLECSARSMFHVAQGVPASEDLVEGCPVVPLDDSPNDLRQLFRLIFPVSGNLKFHGPKVNIAFVSSIIRLDHKYELQGLYGEAMRYLTSYYTTSFDAWADGSNAPLWKPDPIHAIHIVHGCPTNANGGDGCVERLTPDDLRTVLELKARLATENARTVFLLFRFPGPDVCQAQIVGASVQGQGQQGQGCAEVWRRILEQAARAAGSVPHAVASSRALDDWTANADCLPVPAMTGGNGHRPSFPQRTLCAGCRNHLEVRDWELRREI